ncbi:MAG: hypothetical protein LC734_00785 [Acidobacteria bacterium]|nr:hypothetical protein [Acidobacteriota bacterium]
MKHLLHTAFLLTLLVSGGIAPAYSQTKEQKKQQKIFAAVPEHLRARLIQRLDLYVEYERTRQYEKLYDLLWEYVVNPNNLSREAYVNASRKTIAEGYRSILLKFKPTDATDLSLEDKGIVRYDIWGTAKVKSEGKVYVKDAAIEARWINGEWYFAGVADVILDYATFAPSSFVPRTTSRSFEWRTPSLPLINVANDFNFIGGQYEQNKSNTYYRRHCISGRDVGFNSDAEIYS